MKITRAMRQATRETVNREYGQILADDRESANRWRKFEQYSQTLKPAMDEITRTEGSEEAWQAFEQQEEIARENLNYPQKRNRNS